MKHSSFRLLFALCAPSVALAQSFLDIPVTVSSNPDHTLTLQWTGNTTHLYDIEWSPDLMSWSTVLSDYPTVAGAGTWADTGDYVMNGPTTRFDDASPARRFYRLREGRALPASLPSVTLAIYDQDEDAGTITFEATPTAPSGQAIDSVWLHIDGRRIGEPVYEAPWRITVDTRFLPNGTHNAYAVVEDTRGGNTTTGDDTGDQGYGSGVASSTGVSFTSDNLISEAYMRPWQLIADTETQLQPFRAKLAEARDWTLEIVSNATSNVVRTYTGTGSSVNVQWDGKNESNAAVADGFYTATLEVSATASLMMRGAATPEETPTIDYRALEKSLWEELALAVGWDVRGDIPVDEPESVEEPEATILETEQPASMSAMSLSSEGGGSSFSWKSLKGKFGTFGVMFQGHHPAKSFTGSPLLWRAPQRGALSSQRVRFADQPGSYSGPWGPIRSANDVAQGFAIKMALGGYGYSFIYKDDDVTPTRLSKTGSNDFNSVNVGLLIGHSVSALDAEFTGGVPVPQAYYPIYTSSPEAVEWMSTYDMQFGSANLRWLGFYTCNFFRASPYKTNPSYDALKNNGYLPLNGNLAAFCAFATEVTITPSFGPLWATAMQGLHGPLNQPVVNAWGYASVVTQSKVNGGENNVARVVCWIETRDDYLFGYGPQGTPPGPSADTRSVIEVDFQVP